MARTPSKVLTVGERKTAETGLKQALSTVNAGVKASEGEVAVATKALAVAKKKADDMVKASNKVHDKVVKDSGKLIADAQKAVDAATKKHTKVFDAAAKGREKINGQLATLAAAPVEPAKRGPKPKIEATA